MKKTLLFLTFSGILFAFCSCINQLNFDKLDKSVEYGTSVVIPVGQTHTSIFDIIEEINSQSDGSEEWGLGADLDSNFVFLFKQKDLHLPVDNNISTDLSSSSDFNFYDGVSLPQNLSSMFDFDLNDDENGVIVQRIDLMHVRENARLGITAELTNITLGGGIKMNIRFPNIVFEGGVQSFDIDITSNNVEEVIDLPAFLVTFTGGNNLTEIVIDFSALNAGNPPVIVGGNIHSNVKITDMIPYRVEGFFNRSNTVTSDSLYAEVPTDLFKSETIQNNRLLFRDPQVTFGIVNNIGIPLEFIVDYIKATGEKNGQPDEVYADFGGSLSTNVPIERTQVQGDSTRTSITFNREYGKTERLFADGFKPDEFKYEFHVNVNHEAVAAGDVNHFLIRPAKISMYVQSRLPFHFDPTSYYHHTDTLSANLDSVSLKFGAFEIDLDRISIDLTFTNGIPIKAIATAHFLDANGIEVFTKENIEISAPDVYPEGYNQGGNKEGQSVSPKVSTVNIPVDSDDTDKIMTTQTIVIDYLITGRTDGEQINVRATDELKAGISLFVKGKVSTNLDSLFNGNNGEEY
ncbi:MAG: hypothetical protein LBS50_10510 [Prevotellaceae bacterium]|nr:hypothetical protein [Prevotellaceae bacterium]